MEIVFFILSAVFLLAVTLLPVIIAFYRGHASKWAITFVTVFLGWSVIFWFLALIWSLSNKCQSSVTVVNVGSGNSYKVSQKDSQ